MRKITALALIIASGVLAGGRASAATEWSTQDYDLYPGDFDGDGKTDLLYVAKDMSQASGIARSDGTGPNIAFQSWPSNYLGIPWHSNVYTVIVEDFNGDGKADVFLQRSTAGDHFLLLTDAHGKVTGITQTLSNSALGLTWSADQHKIHAGDFSGDGKADLFLQATSSSGTHALVLADGNGLLTAGPQQSWTDASWGAFKWSTRNSNVFVGDFNGDGRADLLVQARPNIVMIDYEIPIPVPTYAPNSNGVVLSQEGASPFQQVGVQQWSRSAHGVDWSSNAAHIVVGDFDNNGRADVLLQSRSSSRSSYLVSGNASGAVFTSGSALASNVTWAADAYRLIAGDFDGTGGSGVYYQAVASSGANSYANVVTGSSVSTVAHNPSAATGVVSPTVVGHTVGSFAVSDAGAATYSIPIVTPPGVAGMQPALSINYASGSGSGLLGLGWGLGGFSEISRCGKTLIQDNSIDAVQLSLSDRFCLDGNKLRLTAGTYGVADSTYQTELETFARVTAVGSAGNGPASFVVEAKDGLIYEYGNTADSRIESLAGSTTAHTWAVNKVTDRHGNYQTFTYQEDGAPNGSFRPTTITYTANASAGLSAAYRVNLYWEARPAADQSVGYLAGGIIRETQRLDRIETQYNDPSAGGWRLVRRYQFSYNASGISGRSRLAAIQECDRNANCLAPTTIGWQEGVFGWSSTTIGSPGVSATASSGMPVDLNGDGRTDFVFYDSASKYWRVMFANSDGTHQAPVNVYSGSATIYTAAMPMDVNGDGKQDLLVANQSDEKWWWIRHNGSSFTAVATSLSYATPGPVGSMAMDVNGDGLDDIVSASTNTIYVALNQYNSNAPNTPNFAAPSTGWTAPDATSIRGETFADLSDAELNTADFDGDSRDDMLVTMLESTCVIGSNCVENYTGMVLRSTGAGFVTSTTIQTGGSAPLRPIAADFNSDGLTDVAYIRQQNGATPTWRYRISSGSLGSEHDTGVPGYAVGVITDCDSDGRHDVVFEDATGNFHCLRSDGSGLANSTVGLGQLGSVHAADANGDGLLDFVGRTSTSVVTRLHRGVLPDFVSSITDGFGNTVSIAYAPLTDPSVYTPGAGAIFPEFDVRGPLYVVKQYSASNGVGGSFTVSETYAQARAHTRGRGFLGFATRSSTDNRTGIRTTSSFRQDYPYIGFAETVSAYQPDGVTLISRTSSTPAQIVTSSTLFNQRVFPYTSQTIQKTYEVGGPGNGLQITEVTTANTLDSYGNPTNITTSTVDKTGTALSYSTSTTNTYDTTDATCWQRGFVTLQELTSSVPGLPSQTRTARFVKDSSNPSACRVYQEIVEPNDTTGELKVTTTIGYDSFGHANSQVVSAANIESRTTSTSYGPQGVFPLSVTQSVTSTFSQSASKTYDCALGVPKTATDPNGLVVSWEYDGFGRMQKETRPDGTKTAFSYAACTAVNGYCSDSRLRYQVEKTELDANNGVIRTSRQLFDSFSRALYGQTQTLSGAFTNVATNYDNLGRAYQQSQPYFSGFPAYFTIVSYDLSGRPIQEQRRISDADSGVQTTQYSYNRLVSSITDANGKVTTKQVNAIGQVVKMTDAANGVTEYEYDPFGHLTKTKDPANNQIVNTYNIRGFKLSTNDPDMGSWIYTYYPTGELWTQRDAKNQTVTFTYDHTARPKTRVESEGTTTFTYGVSSALKNIGRLESVTSPGAFSQSFVYDSLSRLQDATTNADATSFVVSNTYSSTTGLLETVTYPTSTAAVSGSRVKVKYEYEHGVLKRARDFHSPATIYWEQIATNAAGQALDEQLGNGLHTYSTYDSLTGLLGARTAGTSSQVQNLTYQWDKVGNLTQRRDQNLNLTEDFYYDNLYRLDYSKLNGITNLDVGYDALGNITSKTGIGTYTYPASGASAVRPHAVTAAGSNSYSYDSNGNMTNRNGSTITWYSYNLPNRIDQGSNYSQFFYGADRARYKQVAFTAAGGSLPTGTETTIYVGGLYERVTKPSGVIEHKHYIIAGNEAVAIRTLRSNSANDTRYLHKDHLGSLDVITNESGSVVLRLGYDAFGKRRGATAWSGTPAAGDWTSIASITHRGFTFHEELDNVDLVHMNGRVYDANIGRFISADPFVQAPLMSQSLNRYSYVLNNPLSLIDPSGYSWLSKFHRKLRRHIHAHLRFLVNPTPKNFFETIKSTPGQDKIDRYVMTHDWAYKAGYAIAVVSSFWIGGYGGAVYQAYYTYIATGSATQAVMVGVIAAGQQYIGNYANTGSGFSMGSSSRGVVVLSWDGGGAASGGGASPINIFLNAYQNAPSSTAGGTCPGGCHSSGIAIPEVTPEVRAATTRFYQNLGEDFIPGLGLYRAATGEYLFSGDEASRVGGLLASAPFVGFAAKQAATVFRTAHYARRLTAEGVDVAQAERAVSQSIDSMRSSMTIGAEVRGRFFVGDVLVEYRAYPLADGTVSVGTIFPVK